MNKEKGRKKYLVREMPEVIRFHFSMPELLFISQDDTNGYQKKIEQYGDLINELYELIKHNQAYFHEVFRFFTARIEPFDESSVRQRKLYLSTLKSSIKRLGYLATEVDEHIKIFEKILDFNNNQFSEFRGLFLEEFMRMKLEENCDSFQKTFSESKIVPQNCPQFGGFSTNSDFDSILVKYKSMYPAHKCSQIHQIDAFECKANVQNFMFDVYKRVPKRANNQKIIYLSEMDELFDYILPNNSSQFYIVGYSSITDSFKRRIKKNITGVKKEKHYNAKRFNSLVKLKRLFESERFKMFGRFEIAQMFY